MNSKLFSLLFSFILIGGCHSSKQTTKTSPVLENTVTNEKTDDNANQIDNAEWEIHKVSDAIIYKYHHFNNLFDSNQSITILDVNLNKNVKIDIPYVTSGFIKTSEAAINTNTTAAINGSYFNTSTGGSTVFFKKNDEIIKDAPEGFTTYRENAGLALDASGKASILKKPTDGWQIVNVNSLLTSGPLLIYDGKVIEQVDAKFNTNRHPRTAVGVTEKNHLIAVIVDGRSSEAHGMSTEELAVLMQTLGCTDAMNLDGGGSSTAWVKNRGVVNYPSDNKKFDHEGERGVATVITFIEK